MLRALYLSLFGIFCSLPVAAHEGHEIAMHHWDDSRYIGEVHTQIIVLIVAALVIVGIRYIRQLRKTA